MQMASRCCEQYERHGSVPGALVPLPLTAQDATPVLDRCCLRRLTKLHGRDPLTVYPGRFVQST